MAPEAEGEAAAAQEKAPKQKKGKRKAAAGKADDGSDNKPSNALILLPSCCSQCRATSRVKPACDYALRPA